MKNTKKTEIALRDADFMHRCMQTMRSECARGVQPSLRRIVALTVYGHAGGYYLSYARALDIVRAHMRQQNSPLSALRSPLLDESPAQERARHLCADVSDLIAKAHEAGQHLTVPRAVSRVLNRGGARRFYFSVEYGLRLFHSMVRCQTVYSYKLQTVAV